jgi:radical SAM protein with 4Fe4S-binding SPASM domain
MTSAVKDAVLRFAENSVLTRRGLDAYRNWRSARKIASRGTFVSEPWRVFNVELTNRCPFTCVMCARTNNMTRDQGLMDFETFKTIIDEYVAASPAKAASEVTWLHHFGESLVHPEFGKFIRYAVEKGLKPALSINPLLLKPAVARDLLGSGIALLNISLDGHDDASFERIRGVPNAFEKSKANLLEFLKLKVELGVKTHVALSMIDFSMNRESIEHLKKYWESVPGIDEFAAKEFKVWNGDAADVNKLADKRVDNAELKKTHCRATCNVPWEKMSLAWDGDVLPCCYDYDKKYVLGNVKNKTMAEMWNGPEMQALRKEFLDNDVKNPLCRSCPELYLAP